MNCFQNLASQNFGNGIDLSWFLDLVMPVPFHLPISSASTDTGKMKPSLSLMSLVVNKNEVAVYQDFVQSWNPYCFRLYPVWQTTSREKLTGSTLLKSGSYFLGATAAEPEKMKRKYSYALDLTIRNSPSAATKWDGMCERTLKIMKCKEIWGHKISITRGIMSPISGKSWIHAIINIFNSKFKK